LLASPFHVPVMLLLTVLALKRFPFHVPLLTTVPLFWTSLLNVPLLTTKPAFIRSAHVGPTARLDRASAPTSAVPASKRMRCEESRPKRQTLACAAGLLLIRPPQTKHYYSASPPEQTHRIP